MSQALNLLIQKSGKNLSRAEMLELTPVIEYKDGRTKQSFKDETDIQKIMSRFSVSGTISHLAKYEGTYSDFSDFDFHEQTNKLTRGREIFDDLPAEIRREFGQSPAAFFAYVNDPANAEELRKKLPALAKPGQQLPKGPSETADEAAAAARAAETAPTATPAPDPIEPLEGSQEPETPKE